LLLEYVGLLAKVALLLPTLSVQVEPVGGAVFKWQINPELTTAVTAVEKILFNGLCWLENVLIGIIFIHM
jgi:hypothetical protein